MGLRKRRPESTAPQIAAGLDRASVRATVSQARIRRDPGMVVTTYVLPDPHHPEMPRPVTAAAQVIFGRSVTRTPKRPPRQAFQDESWELRDQIGEFRFSGDRVARAVSQLRLYVARIDDVGDKPVQVDEGLAYELGRQMFAQQSAIRQGLERAAQHLTYNGESYFVITQDVARDAFMFEPRSSSELTQSGRSWRLNDGVEQSTLDPDTQIVVRCWKPHPQFAAMADCPARAVLPVARELKGLTEHVSAQIDSRLAGAGLLLVPQSIEVLRGQGHDSDDDDDDLDPFVADLMDMMLTPIKDRDSAAALVPLVAKLPDESVDKVKHIKFFEPLDPKAKELREEAIRRVALGMDSPPEALLGIGAANHWTGWLLEEQEVTLAVAPVGATICHALTTGWLQPSLEQLGVPDWDRHLVWFDASALQLRPDRSADARALHDADVLSDDALLRETGFGDADLPERDELERRLLTRLLLAAPQYAPALLPRLGIDGIDFTTTTGGGPPTPAGAQPDTPALGSEPEPNDPSNRALPDTRDTLPDSGEPPESAS